MSLSPRASLRSRCRIPGLLLAAMLLGGCMAAGGAAGDAAAGRRQVDQLSYLGVDYPIYETASGWRIKVPDGAPGFRMVACRKNTREDCYWSMRNDRTARMRIIDAEDRLGGGF